ncbi:T9SS type A sorting domain-containing protein [bacterium]|nr:T9SS type A sorting domain-containing protein [bacterium]
MRRFAILLLLPAFALLAQAGESFKTARTHTDIVQPQTGIEKTSPTNHLDQEIIYFEDWESGLNGWESVDLTSTPGTWHIDDWFAYGGIGMSWCMGQNPVYCDTVGYNNDWYMVLDSPPLTLPSGNITLTFQSRIACELPGADPPYDGWDGCNLRISIDGGVSWIVIQNEYLEPDYDMESMYSFGFQHGEGLNIPGWCGQHLDWFLQTADLSSWAGQSIKLRWAFASDPSWCTCDATNRRWAFGWQIDDITITSGGDPIFTNDGTDDTGWTSGTNRPVAGDLWRVADDCSPPPCPPPSGTYYLACNNPVSLEYSDNMNNEIMSPYIDMRDLDFGSINVDFMVTGILGSDPNNFPDCDFWHWEVTGDSGLTWCFASNPTCEPAPAQNFVHPDAPVNWSLYSLSYQSGFDITDYIGSVIRIKAVMESNDDGLVGFGPALDDITIAYHAGYPNDFSCTTLQLRFPTVEGQPAYGTAYFANVGSQAPPGAVAAWWKEASGSIQRLLPNLNLNPGESDTRNFVWTPAATGNATLSTWSALNIDENLGNDTSYCNNITVRDSTIDLELGYDNRTSQYAFNFETSNGALIKFTPEADSVELPLNLNKIRVQFDGSQTESAQIGLRVLEDNNGIPGEGLFWGTVTVTTSELLPNWKEITVNGASGTHGIDGDFWVWFEVLDTDIEQRFPKIIGDDAEDWNNHDHYFTYRRGQAPQAQPYFFMVRAQIAEGTSDAEIRELTPLSYSLAQNYPNPFNPMTEIHYSIAETDEVSLRVFNLLGQEVAVLVDALQQAGTHTIAFDGTNLPSGIYLYQLKTPNFTSTRKMVLMK